MGWVEMNITTLSVKTGLCVVIIDTRPVTTPLIKSVNKILRLRLIFQIWLSSAVKLGFELSGYCTQAMFLISLGIENFLLQEEDDAKRNALAQQIKQLILPSAMGETFKVLALSKKQTVKLDGFREQNLLNKL